MPRQNVHMSFKDPVTIAKQIENFQRHIGRDIKIFRSDNGKEYMNTTINNLFNKLKITHEHTVPHSPAQNGKAERFNRTILEMTKSMLKAIPSRAYDLWPYAIDYATWLYNRIPQINLQQKSPYEILHGTAFFVASEDALANVNPEPEIVNGYEEFEVEQILDHRLKNGKNLYLIKWKGYGEPHNSWEPEENMGSCDDVLAEYLSKYPPRG